MTYSVTKSYPLHWYPNEAQGIEDEWRTANFILIHLPSKIMGSVNKKIKGSEFQSNCFNSVLAQQIKSK